MMLKGKKVGILGAGRSGIAAAKLSRRLGATVLLSDVKRVTQNFRRASKLNQVDIPIVCWSVISLFKVLVFPVIFQSFKE